MVLSALAGTKRIRYRVDGTYDRYRVIEATTAPIVDCTLPDDPPGADEVRGRLIEQCRWRFLAGRSGWQAQYDLDQLSSSSTLNPIDVVDVP